MKKIGIVLLIAIVTTNAKEETFSGQKINLPGKSPFLASVWVRAKKDTADNLKVSMILKEASGSKSIYRELGYTRILSSDWSRVSAWVSPAKANIRRLDIVLNVEDGAEIQFKDAKIAEVPDILPPFEKGFIRIDGAKIKNSIGVVVFRGVNLSAYDDDDREDTARMLGVCCEEDYKEIASLGFNSVRLACWQKALEEPGGFDWLRLQISFARKYGLYIILDMHHPVGGYQGPEYKGDFWDEKKGSGMRSRLTDFWEGASKKLKDEPVIAAYDLLNEPKPEKNSQWHEYVKLLVSKIREQGDKHAIVVETCVLSDDEWPELEDNIIIYDTHFYHPWEFVNQSEKKPFGRYNSKVKIWGREKLLNKNNIAAEIDTYIFRCRKRNIPMQVGEYGTGLYTDRTDVGGLEWLRDVVSIFEAQSISRFYWSWDIYAFGLHNGWFRRNPGVFRFEAAKIAGSVRLGGGNVPDNIPLLKKKQSN